MPMMAQGGNVWVQDDNEFVVAEEGKFGTALGFYTDEVEHPKVMVGINMDDSDFAWEVVPFEPDEAFVISRALTGLPAAEAGLRSNDLVIEIDGVRVKQEA